MEQKPVHVQNSPVPICICLFYMICILVYVLLICTCIYKAYVIMWLNLSSKIYVT